MFRNYGFNVASIWPYLEALVLLMSPRSHRGFGFEVLRVEVAVTSFRQTRSWVSKLQGHAFPKAF